MIEGDARAVNPHPALSRITGRGKNMPPKVSRTLPSSPRPLAFIESPITIQFDVRRVPVGIRRARRRRQWIAERTTGGPKAAR